MSKARIEGLICELRSEIKAAGFKARIHKSRGRADTVIVTVPRFNVQFSPEQIRLFCEVAKRMGFTFVMGLEIDVDREAQKEGFGQYWEFYC